MKKRKYWKEVRVATVPRNGNRKGNKNGNRKGNEKRNRKGNKNVNRNRNRNIIEKEIKKGNAREKNLKRIYVLNGA